MDVGRYLSISAAPNDGVLSAVAALVILVVLFWALMPQFWQVTDDLATPAAAHAGPRSHAGPSDATFPIPRTPRVATYQAGPRPSGPRHAAPPDRAPRVSGQPPWPPAPRPPGGPPVV